MDRNDIQAIENAIGHLVHILGNQGQEKWRTTQTLGRVANELAQLCTKCNALWYAQHPEDINTWGTPR